MGAELHTNNILVLLLQCLKVTFNNEFSGIEKIIHTHTHTNCSCARYTHARTNLCVPWLPSLQCNDDWVSPLDWLHSCTTIPLSTVRNHLVSLGLLQSNWPFKEGLYHVKQCNWEWSSLRSIPYFVLLPSTLVFLSVCGPPFPPFVQLLSVCLCLSTSCFCCTLSSADSCWPLKAQCCSCLCYHFQHWTAPRLDRLSLFWRGGQDKAAEPLWLNGQTVYSKRLYAKEQDKNIKSRIKSKLKQ